MSKDRKFVNPLTQRTPNTADTPPKQTPPPSTKTSTSADTSASTSPSTFTPPSPSPFTNMPLHQGSARRKHGAHAFEKTHERITLWIDKELKQRFEALAHEQGTAKTSLLNEAIADLLQKYEGQGQATE